MLRRWGIEAQYVYVFWYQKPQYLFSTSTLQFTTTACRLVCTTNLPTPIAICCTRLLTPTMLKTPFHFLSSSDLDELDFCNKSEEMLQSFKNRGYPDSVVKTAQQRAHTNQQSAPDDHYHRVERTRTPLTIPSRSFIALPSCSFVIFVSTHVCSTYVVFGRPLDLFPCPGSHRSR